MSTTMHEHSVQHFSIIKELVIDASPEIVFASIIDQLGPASEMPGGVPFPMKFEPWPGGRWYRDLGDGVGHFWGHVQVIKPPTLIEICGPLFMSYAATNFVQYRLAAEGSRTRLKLAHNAIGLISDEHRTGVHEGWEYELGKIKEAAEGRASQGVHS